MAARCPKFPGARFSEKKYPDFLKFIGPVTSLWVLQPSEILHMVSTQAVLAKAVFARSIKVFGWQSGAPKSREHDFPKKKRPTFENYRTSDASMGSSALPNHAYGLCRIFTSQSSVCKVN